MLSAMLLCRINRKARKESIWVRFLGVLGEELLKCSTTFINTEVNNCFNTYRALSSDFVITRMITDQIGLHSVLLPLLITAFRVRSLWIPFVKCAFPLLIYTTVETMKSPIVITY